MPPRRSRSRNAEAAADPAAAAAAVPVEDAEEQARPSARQRTGDAAQGDAGDAAAPAPGRGEGEPRRGQALADHSRLLQDGGRRAEAHARAVARAAHFAVFDEGEEDDGGLGARGARAGGDRGRSYADPDAAAANAAHVGGERAAARELGMWATSQALLEGRDAAAAARRAAAAAKGEAAAAEAPALIRWAPAKRGVAGAAAAAPATPALRPSRVPSLLKMTAALVAENLDVVESLEGVPDGARAAVARAAAARRTLDAAGASLLVANRPAEVFVPDASKLDAAAMLALLAEALHPGVERLELGFCGRGLGDSTAASAADKVKKGAGGGSSEGASPPLPLLSHLRLGGAYRLSDRGLSALLSLCPSLRSLALPQAPKVTGAAVAALPRLVPALRVLDLAHCRGIDSGALLSALLGRPGGEGGGEGEGEKEQGENSFLAEIEEIVLDGLPAADDALLLEIARALSSSASSSPKMNRNLPLSRLSRVSLRQCSGVSDAGVVALLEAASSAAAAAAAAAAPSSSSPSVSPPPRYLGLTSLALDGCPISDASLEALSRFPQPLSRLALAGCKNLGDEALALAAESLGVAGGKRTAERAATASAAPADDGDADGEAPPGLRSLSVAGVPRAGERLVAALLRSCPRSLEDVDVSWCRAVPSRALGALADGCPRLRSLTSYGCTHVGTEVVGGHSNPRTVFVGASSMREPPAKDAAAALVLE